VPVSENDVALDAAGLRTILEEATRIFGEVNELCREQRAALVACDTQKIVSLTERAETLAARFRLLESARGAILRLRERGEQGGPRGNAALDRQFQELTRVVSTAALAASGNADLLARSSAATAAIRRVLEGAVSAGYLPTGEHRVPPRSTLLEERA
jgi:hypothetical protein